MRSLEQLDSWITTKVRNWSGKIAGSPHVTELLEIRRDILNDIRDRIHPKGEGRSIFPYNTVSIYIAVEDASRQALFERALGNPLEWEETVSSLLTEAGCPVPTGLLVNLFVRPEPVGPDGRSFHIDFANTKLTGKDEPPKGRPPARITVLRGEADVLEYIIDSERINLGRLKEVISDKDGLRRRNHIAFAETETTVSREHAFIRYEDESGRFRLYDSMSRRGTRVFREGRRFDVPKGLLRGFQLRSGDEIHLGEARLRFDTDVSAGTDEPAAGNARRAQTPETPGSTRTERQVG